MFLLLSLLLSTSMINNAMAATTSEMKMKMKIPLPGASSAATFQLVQAWATAFMELYPEADLTLAQYSDSPSSSSSSSATQAKAALWDHQEEEDESANTSIWGIGDMPFIESDYQDHSTLKLQHYPIGVGAVVMAHSRDIVAAAAAAAAVDVDVDVDVDGTLLTTTTHQPPPSLNLSMEVLVGIFNTSITQWDDIRIAQLNPSVILPSNQPISVVVQMDPYSSRQSSILTNSLAAYYYYNVLLPDDEAAGEERPGWPFSNRLSPLSSSSSNSNSYNTVLEPSEQACASFFLANSNNTNSSNTNNNTNMASTIENTTFTTPPAIQSRYFEVKDQEEMTLGLLRIPYSIGYMEMGYFSKLKSFLGQAHLSNSNFNSNPTTDGVTTTTTATTTATIFTKASKGSITKVMKRTSDLDPTTLTMDIDWSTLQQHDNNNGNVNGNNGDGSYPIPSGYAYWYLKQSSTAYSSCYQAWLLCRFLEWTYTDPVAQEIASQDGWVTLTPNKHAKIVDSLLERLDQVMCILDKDDDDRRYHYHDNDNDIVKTTSDEISARQQYIPKAYQVDNNYVDAIRPIVWSLASVILMTSLGLIAWVVWQRNQRVVRGSQPSFLIMICVGTLVMGSAIFPLGIDESIASLEGCDIACMSFVWLIPFGFTISLSALFSKIWRLNNLMRNHGVVGRRLLKVEARDVLVPFGVLLLLNVTILLSWTIVDPLRWTRIQSHPHNSYGICQAEGGTWMVFMVLIVLVNTFALLLANVEAYKGRDICDEFNESKYISFAMVCMLQALLLGLPLSMLFETNPSARLFTTAGILFLMTMSLLLLMFIPKVLINRKDNLGKNGPVNEKMTITGSVSGIAIKNGAIVAGRGPAGMEKGVSSTMEFSSHYQHPAPVKLFSDLTLIPQESGTSISERGGGGLDFFMPEESDLQLERNASLPQIFNSAPFSSSTSNPSPSEASIPVVPIPPICSKDQESIGYSPKSRTRRLDYAAQVHDWTPRDGASPSSGVAVPSPPLSVSNELNAETSDEEQQPVEMFRVEHFPPEMANWYFRNFHP